jgi:hypothetical protein
VPRCSAVDFGSEASALTLKDVPALFRHFYSSAGHPSPDRLPEKDEPCWLALLPLSL